MKKLYTLFCLIIGFVTMHAQPVIGYQSVATGFTAPVDVVNSGDSRLFIVEQGGRIKIWNGTAVLSTPFLDISSIVNYNGEMGLLSAVFHPDYATNRYFFVFYNSANGNVNLARYQTKLSDPNEADATTAVVLMSIPKPFANHNGAKLNFGADGLLYFATGDGGSGGDPNNYAQTGSSYLGKMLRINVNSFTTPPYYTIPPNNPYINDPIIKPEIIAFGLRNTWRWSFDRQTGDMWLADVGQNLLEEVNFTAVGNLNNNNYGWRCYEASQTFNSTGCAGASNYTMPIFEYGHNNTNGGYSITGGYVYRGVEYPFLQGYYITTDYATKKNWLIKSNGSGGWLTYLSTVTAPANIAGFGESLTGILYAVGLNNGVLYKITASNPVPLKLISFNVVKQNNQHQINWQVTEQQIGDGFVIERSYNNVDFQPIQTVTATEEKMIANYSVMLNPIVEQLCFYRLKLINKNGAVSYSSIVAVNKKTVDIKVVKSGTNTYIHSPLDIQSFQVIDAIGRTIEQQSISPTKTVHYNTSKLSAGLYLIQLKHAGGVSLIKLIN